MPAARFESLEHRRLFAYAPDVSFGRDGQVPTIARNLSGPAVSLIHQDSAGVLVAVKVGTAAQTQFRLARYTLAGQPDPSYTPQTLPTFDTTYQHAFGDSQGRVLVVSNNYVTGAMWLTRYNADGTTDTSFGTSGRVDFTGPFRGHSAYGFHLTEAPDGSIYVASLDTYPNDTGRRRNVYKFTPTGQLDTAFGQAGKLETSRFDFSPDFVAADQTDGFFFSTDSQGRLLVGETPDYSQFRVTRYLSDGRVDTGYAKKGSFLWITGDYSDYDKYHAAFDAQGRVLVLSTDYPTSDLIRINTSGQLDTTFATNGKYSFEATGDTLLVQANGKILVQFSDGLNGENVSFRRLSANGSVDTTFDGDGTAQYIQVNRARENRNLNELTAPRLVTQLADGSFLVGVGTFDGFTLEKVATAQPVRRGTTGRLYLLGSDADDQITVTQPSAGQTRVVFNGTTYTINKHINSIYGLLDIGDNKLDANINVPQVIVAGSGRDTIITGDAEDDVFTNSGNDVVFTNGGYDKISFRGGDKTINAGSGSGYITGGGGANPYRYTGRPGLLRITGTTTDDAKQGGWKVDVSGNRVSVSLGGGTADVTVFAFTSAAVDVTTVRRRTVADITSKHVTYTASRGATRLTANASKSSLITGGRGDDSISTRDGRDTIDGGAGNDTLRGGSGDDSITGGDGDDDLYGLAGNDTLRGGNGSDRLYAFDPPIRPINYDAHNVLDGGPGEDYYLGEGLEQVVDVEHSL